MSNLGHFEKMLSRSHSNHLSQISLSHTEQGSRANELLRKITVFASILVPLNLVAGLFGMNVQVPGKFYPWVGVVVWDCGGFHCFFGYVCFDCEEDEVCVDLTGRAGGGDKKGKDG